MDNSGQIAARWGYMSLWAEAMLEWYGKPPACPSWLEYAFQCWYGNDNTVWPDPLNRDQGEGPQAGLLQSCALAILDGPSVLLRITERRAMNVYTEDLEPTDRTAAEKDNNRG